MMPIDAETGLYGIIGCPVRHSLSPIIQNLALAACDINAVYLAFEVTELSGAIAGVRALGIKGLSVTIPHKINIMAFLDEIDPMAQKIGAVNTLLNRDGYLLGFNTDWSGALLSLKEKTEIKGKRFVILGAGGAARAIAFGLKKEGAEVIIVNRTYEKGQALAQEVGGVAFGWEKLPALSGDVLINTTPVGMWPKVDVSPVDEGVLSHFNLVMDAVYRPLKTKFLQMAEKIGCNTIGGLKMLIYQGAEQFRLWTGKEPPVKKMLEVAERLLQRE